ncbi:MAG: hypothetical protein A2342_08815 [Gallionellales bacterium RIFOXYB12_FULL_54_9]|nr:MAG: hypothetical protein A2342_08815 [Gallionellales bacterium RIFOXYB12_FULL_54_9]
MASVSRKATASWRVSGVAPLICHTEPRELDSISVLVKGSSAMLAINREVALICSWVEMGLLEA